MPHDSARCTQRLHAGDRPRVVGDRIGQKKVGATLWVAHRRDLRYATAEVVTRANSPLEPQRGHGAFSMLVGDLVTAVRYELPIVIVVLNNAKLGFITLEQEAKGLPDWGSDILNPDFVALAKACGAAGFQVTEPDGLEAVLSQARAERGPAVVEVVVDPDALIMPPTIDASQASCFGLAKRRELLGQ